MATEQPVKRTLTNEELKKKGSTLKKVTTKEFMDSLSSEDIAAVSNIFEDKRSSPEELAAAFNVDAEMVRDNPADDGAHFAKLLFSGAYLRDNNEAAKDQLRRRLAIDLKNKRATLKKSITRQSTGPSSDDLKAAAKIYTECKGDLTKIAEKCGLTERLMNKDPPHNAEEFAQKVLAGNYTEEATEASKEKLRAVLRPEIMSKRPSLKRISTKEHTGEPSAEDIAIVAKMYDSTNMDAVAQKLGLAFALLKEKPPADAKDFAKKVLEGAYTQDTNEVSKQEFRSKLLVGIMQKRPSLKQAPTTKRRISNVTEEELTNFGNFFTKHKGNAEAISKESGIPTELLKSNPPADASDFVQKLLDGDYTFEMDEQAKQNFRATLRKEMLATKDRLKKMPTKEWDGLASESDITMFAKAYTQRSGDLAKLADMFSLSLEAVQMNPPENERDFAKNVLLGYYTPDKVAKLIDDFRQSFAGALKQHGQATLKHAETKERTDQPAPGEIAKIAKIYNDLSGDLAQCASAVGADFAELSKNKPLDANDFAVKVLAGAYSTEEVVGFRRRMSALVHRDMAAHGGLKATNTKEGLGEPKEEDIANYAKVFTENDGNLMKLSVVLGCDAELLKKDAPTDARKFALKYLAGGYQK